MEALPYAECCAKALNHEIFLPGILGKLSFAVLLRAFLLMTRIAHSEGGKLKPALRKVGELISSLSLACPRLGKSSGASVTCLACTDSGCAWTSSAV